MYIPNNLAVRLKRKKNQQRENIRKPHGTRAHDLSSPQHTLFCRWVFKIRTWIKRSSCTVIFVHKSTIYSTFTFRWPKLYVVGREKIQVDGCYGYQPALFVVYYSTLRLPADDSCSILQYITATSRPLL